MNALVRYFGAFVVFIALAGYATSGVELPLDGEQAKAGKHLEPRSELEVVAKRSPANYHLVRVAKKDAPPRALLPPKIIIETPRGPLVMTIIPNRQHAKREALRRYLRAKRRALLKKKLLRRYLHEMLEEKLRQKNKRQKQYEQRRQRWLKAHKQDIKSSRQIAPYSI